MVGAPFLPSTLARVPPPESGKVVECTANPCGSKTCALDQVVLCRGVPVFILCI